MSAEPKPAPGYLEDKEAIVKRLSRIEGQVRGLGAWSTRRRTASTSSPRSPPSSGRSTAWRVKLLADHTDHCVREAVARGGAEADEKMDELMAAVERFARTR